MSSRIQDIIGKIPGATVIEANSLEEMIAMLRRPDGPMGTSGAAVADQLAKGAKQGAVIEPRSKFAQDGEQRTWKDDVADAKAGTFTFEAPQADTRQRALGELLLQKLRQQPGDLMANIGLKLGELRLNEARGEQAFVAAMETSERISRSLAAAGDHFQAQIDEFQERIAAALNNIWRSDRNAFDTDEVDTLLERVRDGLGENEHYVPQDGQHQLEAEIEALINALATFGQQVQGQALSAEQITQAVTNITAGTTEICGRYFTPAQSPMMLISEQELAGLRAKAAVGERTMSAFEYVSTERPDLEALAKLFRKIEDGKLSVEDEIDALYPVPAQTQSEGS